MIDKYKDVRYQENNQLYTYKEKPKKVEKKIKIKFSNTTLNDFK
jgi:hypothetical protein